MNRERSIHIALFRGINVGGRNKVVMADLRGLFESLGHQRVETYVQSGNVVFEATDGDPARLAGEIEAAFETAFGFPAAAIVIDGEEFARIVAANPFARRQQGDGTDLYVTFLREPPRRPVDVAAIRGAAGKTPDEFVPAARHVYLRCANGYARTKLSNDFFERHLGVTATTRNWRTTLRLNMMAEAAR